MENYKSEATAISPTSKNSHLSCLEEVSVAYNACIEAKNEKIDSPKRPKPIILDNPGLPEGKVNIEGYVKVQFLFERFLCKNLAFLDFQT